jgi:hypothetical protein
MNLLVCILSKKKNLVGLHLITQMVRQVPLLPPNIQTYNNVGLWMKYIMKIGISSCTFCVFSCKSSMHSIHNQDILGLDILKFVMM